MKAWTKTVWRKDEQAIDRTGAKWRHFPATCNSWRHAGACAKRRAAEDIERIQAATAARPGGYVYCVLTFARDSFDGDYARAYRGMLDSWAQLRKRFVRQWGKIEYVAVAERHRDGWPHLNLLVRNEGLAAACADGGWKRVRSKWLEPAAKACGFGFRTWIEPQRSEAIAAYLVKLAGEIGKASQVPLNAPRHFRRLRGSRGFLPPRPKNPDITGKLTRREVEEVEALGLSPLPAFRGVPREVDRSEAGAEDRWYATVDATEVEPGVIVYAEPYTREVLWCSYSFASSRGSPGASGSESPGACAGEAPPFFDSAMAAAEWSALVSERQQAFGWDA